jgi:hypothetical protein
MKPPEVAAHALEVYGYAAPNLLRDFAYTYDKLKGKERQDARLALKKIATDYVDAYLISRWAEAVYADLGTIDVNTTQRLSGRQFGSLRAL